MAFSGRGAQSSGTSWGYHFRHMYAQMTMNSVVIHCVLRSQRRGPGRSDNQTGTATCTRMIERMMSFAI